MAKFFISKILNSEKGQSAVEYILLIAVIASVTFAVINNKKFKDFMKGDSGLFASMREGMMYSFRYGRDIRTAENPEQSFSFEYNSPNHDLYMIKGKNETHFFMGQEAYGEQ